MSDSEYIRYLESTLQRIGKTHQLCPNGLKGDYGQDEDGNPIVGPSGSIYAQRSDG